MRTTAYLLLFSVIACCKLSTCLENFRPKRVFIHGMEVALRSGVVPRGGDSLPVARPVKTCGLAIINRRALSYTR